ncbi:MAG TPA: cytidylate kinase-like family protein [Gaiellaceae bacterium]|jgi:cytidylate kinase|nr:cytidylate kinase-like family protein [Gaiellaceae bacterium]
MACTVVCISHAAGAGGEEVGRLVADRLGFLYVNEEIVARAAAKGGVDAADVADEERRKSLAARALNAIAQGGGEAWTLGAVGPLGSGDELDSDDIRSLIRETIEQTAARGKAVIVAHAASYAIGHGDGVLRVLVTASPETRTTRVAEAEGLDQAGAARAVKESDAGRADYLKRFYDVREESPTHYDVVLNTDALTVEQAADLISEAAA